MYQLDYVPIKLANLNDYFTRYRETRNEKHFNEFLYFYEPVLIRNAQLFIKKYSLESSRIDDLKQIFSSLLWTALHPLTGRSDLCSRYAHPSRPIYPAWNKGQAL